MYKILSPGFPRVPPCPSGPPFPSAKAPPVTKDWRLGNAVPSRLQEVHRLFPWNLPDVVSSYKKCSQTCRRHKLMLLGQTGENWFTPSSARNSKRPQDGKCCVSTLGMYILKTLLLLLLNTLKNGLEDFYMLWDIYLAKENNGYPSPKYM